MGSRTLLAFLFAGLLQAGDPASDARKDVQLRAMLDELARSKALQLNDLDKPYFIEYDSGDSREVAIAASLGGLLYSNSNHYRVPRLVVRVGDYKFDNTNSIFSGFPRLGMLAIDDDYAVLRQSLWLATDSMYKEVTEQMTHKRNALREISDPDKTPDFAPAAPIQELEKIEPFNFDQSRWEGILRRASAKFVDHPGLHSSGVSLRVIGSAYRLVNSEGTIIRVPQDLNDLSIRTQAQGG